MKKSSILLIFFLFFNGSFFQPTLDTENIKIDLKRLDDEKILVTWSIDFETYDDIVLQISHKNKIETIQLESPEGEIELCCYPDYVRVTIRVFVTELEDVTGPDCPASECKKIVEMEYLNQKLLKTIPPPTTTSTTTTSTTTTTIPPPIIEETEFLNIEITNELITSIPLFEDIDLTDQEKNSIAVIVSTGIIFLFYIVLLLQEWFNKVISTNNIRWFSKDKNIRSSKKFITLLKILFVLFSTAFLIGFVEEGADLSLDLENVAIFIAALIGLISVTLFYEGTEGLIESKIFKQKVRVKWAPQAIFFAGISTLAFIYFQMPIGFIFGFFASAYISGKRNTAKLSPKFYSTIVLSLAGFGFFYLTSIPFIKDSTVLTAVAALSYLMCLEGVLFKSLPGGGNELFESLTDSKGVFKIFPLISFIFGLWLFIRILIVPPDSEFANMQQDLLSMGSFSLTFAIGLIGYILTILILGLIIKFRARR